MKIKRLPLEDVITIARIVLLEPEEEEEDGDPFAEESIKPGTYALDGEGRIWRLEETVTSLFQEFMDAGPGVIVRKRGK